MRPRLTAIAAAAFLSGAMLSACAADGTAPPPGGAARGDACFWSAQVSGFRPARSNEWDAKRRSDRIVVSVGANRSYLFETLGSCPDIDWSETIGFDQRGPGQICSGLDVTLVVPSPIGPQRCAVRMIRPLSPEEARNY